MHKVLEDLKRGGVWLAAARSWIQRKAHNGSRVTWGSDDVLLPHLTVRQVEDMAMYVAATARHEALLEAADLLEGKDNAVASELRKRANG